MQNTAEAARALLLKLSDDELARYGEIARDQAAAEVSRWWVQAVLAVGALVAFGWAVLRWGIAGNGTTGIEAAGFGRAVAIAAGLGLLLAYSPYKRVKNWFLWRRHCKAVLFEQKRRLGAPAPKVRVDVAR
jgi:hypothetical protein